MRFSRASGILLHPTSLPGRFGIGDLGPEAYRFVDFLAGAGQRLWQVLPLGPTGYGDSPYQCFSAFAGNPLLINLETLIDEKVLDPKDLENAPGFDPHRVDYGQVISYKLSILQKAYEYFRAHPPSTLEDEFRSFCWDNGWWLHDYAVFMSVKEAHHGVVWTQWEEGIARRRPDAYAHWEKKLSVEIDTRKFWQFLFFKQWRKLKEYCNKKGISIIGDIPIYVAHDSADVWAQPEIFHLDERGNPLVVAGVPPDYFSQTGQLWGNPIYRWDKLEQSGFQWWIARFQETLRLIDIVRLDHFRGFESYWEVPATESTAVNGRWVAGPGRALFNALQNALGELKIIAENLGVITPEVEELRLDFEFPGMAILQFAFGSGPANPYLPHNFTHNLVAYTGTHDNDTTVGWWQAAPGEGSTRTPEQVEQERTYARKYLNTTGGEIHWDCIRVLMSSVADTVIFPLQDILGDGSEARMNLPGNPGGNWQWRFTPDRLTDVLRERLRDLTETYGRLAPSEKRT